MAIEETENSLGERPMDKDKEMNIGEDNAQDGVVRVSNFWRIRESRKEEGNMKFEEIERGSGVMASSETGRKSSMYAAIVLEHDTGEVDTDVDKVKNEGVLKNSSTSDSPLVVSYEDFADDSRNEGVSEDTSTFISPPLISYELFTWTWTTILMVLAIIDRFTWNVWPRNNFSIGSGSAGGDRMGSLKEGPWSVAVYDAVARISGRHTIICYNILLLTRLEFLEDMLSPGSFVAKYILNCTNMINANIRIHKWNGIAIIITTMLHVWSILFPCIFHGWSAKVIPGNFEWILSERTPTKCSVEQVDGCWPGDANTSLKQMGLQVDDAFRLIEMTLFMCILLPLSLRWLESHWHSGIQLHRFINLVYFVDIVRRHTHPHSWVLNTPMFVIYLIDKYLYGNYWHRNSSPEMKKVIISDDFIVLYFINPKGLTNTVGPDYAFRLKNSSSFEWKHVMTCFENRTGNDLGDEVAGNHWTVGVVIRVFRRKRIPAILTDKVSHTERIFFDDKCDMTVTGPRQGEMSETLRYALCADKVSPVVLIGAGSAINFIIDALQFCTGKKITRHNVYILYTTRDLNLFEWANEAISSLVDLGEAVGIKFTLKMACTTELEKIETHRFSKRKTVRNTAWFEALNDKQKNNVSLERTRIDLDDSIPKGSTVFCQGSAGLKDVVKFICKKKGATYHLGRGGSREDQV